MNMTLAPRIAPALLAVLLALPGQSAQASIQTREENMADPRGWSAIAGMDPRAVREVARTLPLSEDAVDDQPWCEHKADLEQTLSHDFGEARIATGTDGVTLWGSDVLGTWTVVFERPDATSCVIASGIGFSDATSPQVFFVKAGFNG
ncbi:MULTISPECIES: hypothetical protein [Paracoccus]|jgi:hypothetical protein|uniref:Uncharacterized protein n=2 Tax=Paracoccus denitrificans TaxID=266 RepID=A1B5H4_PARDP|nr:MULTISPECIES: hypothetical protein [Paracoccus]ABL70768.1 hypothetical protein Pden_2681 [Paracoccus denitrificans PD1222]MBB4628940.1 hypothetical protein [Paracoccus denitrificans]MCU7429939.1 hypothetical protein [Paracoccus denitrificans]QAR26090.1 hypothetical protein EO213_07115 [Paracoccus denitrificans]UPV95006.1 hypothetical protein M0K93_14410 [Paracoccus denitrificans]